MSRVPPHLVIGALSLALIFYGSGGIVCQVNDMNASCFFFAYRPDVLPAGAAHDDLCVVNGNSRAGHAVGNRVDVYESRAAPRVTLTMK